MYRQRLLFCLAATLLLSAGCATTKVQDTKAITAPPTPPADATIQVAAVDQGITDGAASDEPIVVAAPAEPLPASVLQNVPFEYEQHLLTDAAREILAANALILKEQTRLRVTLAGHCDERGTDQYNIALGQRRSEAVRNYLLSLGISEGRLEAVSYGEEKPLDPEHDESAWVKNRRVEFVPLQ